MGSQKNNSIIVCSCPFRICPFSAFSIAKGKIAVDTVKNIRESGNAVAVYLENASKRQYDQMIYPDYIEDYGWQYSIRRLATGRKIFSIVQSC